MLHKVIAGFIRSDHGGVQAESRVVVAAFGTALKLIMADGHLGGMELIGFLRHVKTCFPAEGGQRPVPVHDDPVFPVFMQVQFFDLPCAVLIRGGGELLFIRRPGETFLCCPRGYPVRTVPVFAVFPVRDEYFRPEPPDPEN